VYTVVKILDIKY